MFIHSSLDWHTNAIFLSDLVIFIFFCRHYVFQTQINKNVLNLLFAHFLTVYIPGTPLLQMTIWRFSPSS